jgi:dephospho-CoA kinase
VKVIGLAGGTGTGKSTIAAHLVRRGAGHIDADRVTHDVLERDRDVRQKIVARFGGSILSEGRINRRALGAIVFRDAEARLALNAIIHPAIVSACAREIETLRQDGKRVVVIDAALLLEVPLPFDVDLMIALRCDRGERARRLQAKAELTDADIEARLESQASIEDAFDRADVVVDTGRPLAAVLGDIDRLTAPLWDGEE